MPLHKRKPFPLLEPPKDLDPNEHVFQVRFTKEIFKDYQHYLNRLNLYRQRVWTCKFTGKTYLTYEEALVSEHCAMEKVQEFPKDLAGPVLQMVQYSMLWIGDLVNVIYDQLRPYLSEGMELQGKKDNAIFPCKIVKVLGAGRYEVGWLDKGRKVVDTSVLNAEDLIRKKSPVTRSILKAFIRESTSQSIPWLVHEQLAEKYGIPTEPPAQLKDSLYNAVDACGNKIIKKRRKADEISEVKEDVQKKSKKGEKPIKYPIDDLLVIPLPGDPSIADRPSPSNDFRVPMDCVGDLLMVWNFCSSFGRFLNLSPFSLEDFENAIFHKDSILVLIAESHSAMLRLLIKDKGDYYMAVQKKNRKSKITLVTWTEYLCDFLEMGNKSEVRDAFATIKRGHYGLLETRTKLAIFRELVSEILMTNSFRSKLTEFLEQQQALKATKREEDKKNTEEQKDDSEIKNLENGKQSMHDEKSADEPKSIKGHRRGKVKDKVTHEDLEREIDKLSIRVNSLGRDRNYSRYWFFRREARLFVESLDSKQWGFYTSKEELDALLASLNPKGVRERALEKQLEKHYGKISTALQKRSKDVAQRILVEEAVLRRSTRVRAQPKDSQATAFLRYTNRWKDSS